MHAWGVLGFSPQSPQCGILSLVHYPAHISPDIQHWFIPIETDVLSKDDHIDLTQQQ